MKKLTRLQLIAGAGVGGILAAVLLRELFLPPWFLALPQTTQGALWALGLAAYLAAVVAVERISYLRANLQSAQTDLQAAGARERQAYRRLEAIFQVNQKFVEASDEKEVVELMLRLAVDLAGATGATFVPLDEHGQPSTALSRGQLPFAVMNDWIEYLASPAVRERCRTCEKQSSIATSCPLLHGPFAEAIGMYCLPVRRGEREFGVLNLFLPNVETLDAQTQAFLRAMADETALALESVRLRRRELEALRQMQLVRQKNDLSVLLSSLLENIHQTLEADFAVLIAPPSGTCLSKTHLSFGIIPENAQPFVDSIIQGVIASGKPFLLGEVAGDPAANPGVRSLMAAPLASGGNEPIGVILVGNCRSQSFHPRQLALLQTVAGQVALVVQNANLMAELQYKTMIEERTRLAREIHDGLAQTLGFLKLQVAQMQNYLTRKEYDRLAQSTEMAYTALSEAYQDVRQAIDGLRIGPNENGLAGWLEQTAAEFEEITGLSVALQCKVSNTDLLPEVHAQLIRIVQEALSNVRKHAQAKHVWVLCTEEAGDLWLEVRDDGQGFSPEDISAPSRHGLRGMRERAELIGADFQVVSRPGEGAAVRVRLPLAVSFSSNKVER